MRERSLDQTVPFQWLTGGFSDSQRRFGVNPGPGAVQQERDFPRQGGWNSLYFSAHYARLIGPPGTSNASATLSEV